MLSGELKDITQQSHRLLEKKIIERIKAIQNEKDYAEVLKFFYSFFGGLEILIAKISFSFLPDYNERRRAEFIANDLYALHAALPALAQEHELPVIKNECGVTGALYVMEGSTLGGVHIATMIRKKIKKTGAEGFLFFNGYGSETNSKWHIFKNAIDDLELTNKEEQVVIASAENTFTLFSKWLDEHP